MVTQLKRQGKFAPNEEHMPFNLNFLDQNTDSSSL